ncbi:MAG TPA: quinone-dependent dihydroorotate dehydrogenase, partial [Candidatus Binataceae bacterium]|nr:quinone-dependent dihydroorotate dehydrogenase [Candidatus Binataceae bacterium]
MPMIPGALYRGLLRPILFSLDAEVAHHLTLSMLSMMPRLPCAPDPPELRCSLWRLEFSNPIGLAAGMDKDAIAIRAWQSLGFGFAELGTITPRPQAGNPKPRVFRLPAQHALINRLGFPGEGMEAIAPRIERARRDGTPIRLALNFGPNKDTPVENVAADYAALMRRLGALADFIVINVSSPNTPGLRNWQSPEKMRELFAAMNDVAPSHPPMLLKVAPDLDDEVLGAICDTAIALRLDGMVVCNTTLKREEVGVASNEAGGLSGHPLRELARERIASVYRRTGGRLPIIGV